MKHLTINAIKPNFEKKTNSMYYTVKKKLYIKSYSPSKTRGLERYRNPISFNRQNVSSRTR